MIGKNQSSKCDQLTIRNRSYAMNFIKKWDKCIPHKLRLHSYDNYLLAGNANDHFIDRIVT